MKNYKKIILIFVLYLAVFFSELRMDDYLFDGNLNQELSTLKRQHKIDDFEIEKSTQSFVKKKYSMQLSYSSEDTHAYPRTIELIRSPFSSRKVSIEFEK